MKKLKLVIFIGLALMLVLTPLLSGCAKEEAPAPAPPPEIITIRFTSHFPPVAPSLPAFQELETIIPERTNGRVKFEFYPASQLYDMIEGMLAVQEGAVEMTHGGFTTTTISKGYDVMSGLSFLFDDDAHLERFVKTDAFKALNDGLEAKGIKHIVYIGTPGACHLVNFRHPIETVEDLSGVKLRFPPMPMMLEAADLLGIEAVAIPFAEFGTALETGMVDGHTTNWIGIVVLKIPKKTYVTVCYITQIPNTIIANAEWWNSLPPDLQETLMDVFEETAQKIDLIWKETGAKFRADCEADSDIVITELTKAEKARWREKIKPVYEKVMAESEEARMIIEAVESVR